MAKTLYCWRCKQDMPMLEEHEWQQIKPYMREWGRKALDTFFEITGLRETNKAAIGHHRVSLYGPPCRACGKPLRTPKAKLCAACGTLRDVNPVDHTHACDGTASQSSERSER